jgi:hypothetical protein
MAHEDGLRRVATFLNDLQTRLLIDNFEIRPGADGQHFVDIRFIDQEQFNPPVQRGRRPCIHAGAHGFMIENVAAFSVTTVEDLDLTGIGT